jgi:hypothetical protein
VLVLTTAAGAEMAADGFDTVRGAVWLGQSAV